jgi:hypothetical protein
MILVYYLEKPKIFYIITSIVIISIAFLFKVLGEIKLFLMIFFAALEFGIHAAIQKYIRTHPSLNQFEEEYIFYSTFVYMFVVVLTMKLIEKYFSITN